MSYERCEVLGEAVCFGAELVEDALVVFAVFRAGSVLVHGEIRIDCHRRELVRDEKKGGGENVHIRLAVITPTQKLIVCPSSVLEMWCCCIPWEARYSDVISTACVCGLLGDQRGEDQRKEVGGHTIIAALFVRV